ncbi:hypothetical protein METSCH_A11020 [Metschnikowia aff. pulcherrima]|uniref:Uncharacterized protein n=1 Tax=Metschnikowia aff. pulcherrima TaxID=2163413 RepID=A0A4P6XH09_9ASCO|nr:hypothetical protein METSCH_A11020 [Metschnikowia aff. pulcherrima]
MRYATDGLGGFLDHFSCSGTALLRTVIRLLGLLKRLAVGDSAGFVLQRLDVFLELARFLHLLLKRLEKHFQRRLAFVLVIQHRAGA